MQNSGSVNGQVVLSAEKGTTTLEGTGRIAATGAQDGQTGGTVKLLGTQVGMLDSSSINVSGTAGGGTVIIGGNFHGAGPEANATATYIGPDATIKADATINGNGGNVAVWADKATGFYGNISAQGGPQGGNGGFVETSGKEFLDFQGLVNTAAPKGSNGTLLLDPTDITISAAANTGTMIFNGGTFTYSDVAISPSNLNATTLTTQLGLTNVTVTTASGLTGNGDISVNAPVNWNSANSLTLKADRNINVIGNSVSNAGTGGITMNATGDINVSGATVSAQTIGLSATNINVGAAGATASSLVNSTGVMTLNATNTLTVAGANAGTGVSGNIISNSGQTITAGNIIVRGGTGGTNNLALIDQLGAGANQNITITGGGAISVLGGGGTNSFASILSQGATQQINFAAGGSLTVTGGTGVSRNFAIIESDTGKQTISGAPAIFLTGGSGGAGTLLDSNFAIIGTAAGAQDQTISAAGITLTGGAGGTQNRALILHDGSGAQAITATGISVTGGSGVTLNEAAINQSGVLATQSVTVNGGGTITLQGGSGTSTNSASIFNKGTQQTINFTAGGALNLTGGTVGNFNVGRVESLGKQTISGAPNITLQGGASGGAVGLGNAAEIRAEGATQTISANNLLLQGGAGNQCKSNYRRTRY